MLQVIKQTECERDIKLVNGAWVEVVNVHPAKFNIEPKRLPHKQSLADMLALAINAEHAHSAAPFGLKRIEAGVAPNVQQRLATEVEREKFLNRLPRTKRMIYRLAHHAPGLGVDAVAEIDTVKPRLQPLQLR